MDFAKEQIDLIRYGREERQLEYKGSLDFSKDSSKALLSRAIAAHCNARDGGDIVVGMEKRGESYAPTGVAPEHLSVLKSDELRDYVRAHFLPMPNFNLGIGVLDRPFPLLWAVVKLSHPEIGVVCAGAFSSLA